MYKAYDMFKKLKGGSHGNEESDIKRAVQAHTMQDLVGQSKVLRFYSK